MKDIRLPAVAGMFYEADPARLARTIATLLDQAEPGDVQGSLRGLVVPHAGYMYSGSTAAAGYRLLQGKQFDVVVIVAPSHREYFDGAAIYPGDGYRTPIGDVAIEPEVREELVAGSRVLAMKEEGHRTEHSVEVQLPFLQKVLGDFSFVPIVMGNQARGTCELLAADLVRTLRGRKALLLASSDLSHYHPYDLALSLDRIVLKDVEAFDEESLLMNLENDSAEACGGGPIVVVMKALKELGANRSQILFYCNSGDVTGKKDGVVGYLSAAFTQKN